MAESKRYEQIDILKGIAAIMVLVNHSLNFIYTSEWLYKLSRVSVSIFILCSGITLYLSFSRFASKKEKSLSLSNCAFYVFRNILRLMLPYSLFVVIFYAVIHRCINFEEVVPLIFTFKINRPCYYFVIYIGLILITPLIYYTVEKIFMLNCTKKIVAQAIFIAVCAVFGYLNVKYTIVMEHLFTAGKYLFGGTYLPLFAIGALIGKNISLPNYNLSSKKTTLNFSFSTVVLTLWIISLFSAPAFHDFIEKQLIPGIGGNPPGLSIFIGCLIFSWFIWSLYNFLDKIHISTKIFYVFTICGKHSLYIFMYNQIVKYIIYQIIAKSELPSQSLYYGIPYYLLSTVGVILIYKGYKSVCRFVFSKEKSGGVQIHSE